MPLLKLPAELMLEILEDVGAAFFQQDLGRLTICKQWYPLASTVIFKDFTLTSDNLPKIMNSPKKDELFTMFKAHAQELYVRFHGHQLQIPVPLTFTHDPTEPIQVLQIEPRYTPADMDDDLREFVQELGECHRLKGLFVKATQSRTTQCISIRSYTIADMFLSQKLTNLELDFLGCVILARDLRWPDHLCHGISAVLSSPNLRRFRLRISHVCLSLSQSLLKVKTTSLTDVVISIWPVDHRRTNFVVIPAKYQAMKEVITSLAAAMNNAQRVELHVPTIHKRIEVLDALTGRTWSAFWDVLWEEERGRFIGAHRDHYSFLKRLGSSS